MAVPTPVEFIAGDTAHHLNQEPSSDHGVTCLTLQNCKGVRAKERRPGGLPEVPPPRRGTHLAAQEGGGLRVRKDSRVPAASEFCPGLAWPQ